MSASLLRSSARCAVVLSALAFVALLGACSQANTLPQGDATTLPDTTPDTKVDVPLADGTDLVDSTDLDVPADEYTGPACTTTSACKEVSGNPYCNVAQKKCVECLFDLHCTDGKTCKSNVCTDVSCVPGTSKCAGQFLEVCAADGKSVEQQACPDDKPFCTGDKCRACEPNKLFCQKAAASGGTSMAVLQCNADGSASTTKETCKAGTICTGQKCQACVPGTRSCLGDTAMECASDGTGFQVAQDCSKGGWTCLGGLCVNACASDIKSNTNVGCDYWAVDLDNALEVNSAGVYDAQNAQFSVIVSNTSANPAIVDVTLGVDKTATGAKTKQWTVQPKALQIINLPDPSWQIPNQNQDGTNINGRVYRIQASQPIVAYQFNPLQNYGVFSNDASLLLPTNSLGTKYYILSRQQDGNYRSYINIIATLPGVTNVKVVPSARTLAGPNVPAMEKGQSKSFQLKQGESLNIESDQEKADLTGSYIESDRSVAVFGGSEASNSPTFGNCVPSGVGTKKVCASTVLDGSGGTPCTKDTDCEAECCSDHLEEQMFPVTAWGKQYVGGRLQPRGKERDAWRILAAENGTKVTLTPAIATVPMLSAGQWYEFETDKDFMIQADKPIQVGQYMASSYATVTKGTATCTSDSQCVTQHGFMAKCEYGGTQKYCAPIGDPSLILGVATDQYLDKYLFLVPDKYKFNYINILAPQGAVSTIDGIGIAPQAFVSVPGTGWMVARMLIAAGTHRLETSQKAGLLVYGYDDDVSYGYPGGAGMAVNQP